MMDEPSSKIKSFLQSEPLQELARSKVFFAYQTKILETVGMHLETDLEKIKQLAKERDNENLKFRTFLKNHDIEVEELDQIVNELYQKVSKNIDCCSCGNCCREISPLISLPERKHLSKITSLSEEEVTNKYLKNSDENNTFIFKTKPCPFLDDNKCSIYDDRPKDCRSYPHLDKTEFVFRLWGVMSNYAICPIVFNVYEQLKTKFWTKPYFFLFFFLDLF